MISTIWNRFSAVLIIISMIWVDQGVHADNSTVNSPSEKDPHYNDIGFFDIHICNWPDRPMFYMLLFSTTQYELIKKIEVIKPNGKLLTHLDLERFRVVIKPGSPEKRVFITQIPVGEGALDGWYKARIHLIDGRIYGAEDYVLLKRMAIADHGISPPSDAGKIPIPKELRWQSIPDARYYKVFLIDKWEDGKVIFESKLSTSTVVTLPADLLVAGGWYAWRIHARDINEDVKLGDFNHGSLSEYYEFYTAD